jgi:hypothetical protein
MLVVFLEHSELEVAYLSNDLDMRPYMPVLVYPNDHPYKIENNVRHYELYGRVQKAWKEPK